MRNDGAARAQAKPKPHRVGFDQIRDQGSDPALVTFADGCVEKIDRGSWRHCELAVASAHAAVRDVMIRPFDLGRSILIVYAAKGYRRDSLIDRTRDAVAQVLGLYADVQIEVVDWLGMPASKTA